MNIITLKTTLLYYDCPQIFIGVDKVGTNYLCMAIEEGTDEPKYYCTPIYLERYYRINTDIEDILSVFKTPEINQYFIAKKIDEGFVLEPTDFHPEWLSEV